MLCRGADGFGGSDPGPNIVALAAFARQCSRDLNGLANPLRR